MLNSFAAGLTWYYFVSNVITFAQQAITKTFVDDTKIRAQLDANKIKNKDKKPGGIQGRHVIEADAFDPGGGEHVAGREVPFGLGDAEIRQAGVDQFSDHARSYTVEGVTLRTLSNICYNS